MAKKLTLFADATTPLTGAEYLPGLQDGGNVKFPVSAVVLNRLLHFDTIDAATAATIPASEVTVCIDNRRSTTGALCPAMWTKRASQPSHSGKFQSADGAWWEIAEFEIRPEMCSSAALGGSGNETANMAALNMAIAAIKGRGYGALRLGRQYATNAAVAWSGSNICIKTDHQGCGLLVKHTGNGFEFGAKQSASGVRGVGLVLEPMTITQNLVGSLGAGIVIWNTDLYKIDSVYISGCHRGIVLGEDTVGVTNDVSRGEIIAPTISPLAAGGGAIQLLNGGIVYLVGGMLNGAGTADVAGITIGGTNRNWDGAFIIGVTLEQWSLGIVSRGKGCANIVISHMQQDRAAQFGYDFSPASGGTCHHIEVADSHVYDVETAPSTNTSIGFQASTDNGGAVDNIELSGGSLRNFGKQAVRMKGVTDGRVIGVHVRSASSQSSGTYASIQFDTCDGYSAAGCHVRGTYHKYGIDKTGSTNGKNATDLATVNNIVGAITAPTV